MSDSSIKLNADVRKGLRILIDSVNIDEIPGLNLTNQGEMCVREALEWMESKAYDGELVGLYSSGNYDPYGAW